MSPLNTGLEKGPLGIYLSRGRQACYSERMEMGLHRTLIAPTCKVWCVIHSRDSKANGQTGLEAEPMSFLFSLPTQ